MLETLQVFTPERRWRAIARNGDESLYKMRFSLRIHPNSFDRMECPWKLCLAQRSQRCWRWHFGANLCTRLEEGVRVEDGQAD